MAHVSRSFEIYFNFYLTRSNRKLRTRPVVMRIAWGLPTSRAAPPSTFGRKLRVTDVPATLIAICRPEDHLDVQFHFPQ